MPGTMTVTELLQDTLHGEVPSTRSGLVAGLLRTARPRQWSKNVLVAAAPLAAARGDLATVRATGVIFIAFCLAACAIYYLNDTLDVAADRAHPDKCDRPVAAGVVPVRLAWVMSLGCASAALVVAGACTTGSAFLVVAIYLLLNVAYCSRLKHVIVVDLALVSSGFLLRAMAGGLAAGLPLSQWFLLVAGFGSLFVVAGKRYSEIIVMGERAALSRRSLAAYSASYLRFVWGTAAAIAITAYCLWAFEVSHLAAAGAAAGIPHLPWSLLSVVPFTFSVLGYAYFVDSGRAGKPEDVVLGSPVLPLLGLMWAGLFGLGALHV